MENITKNKKASFDYEFIEILEVGIVLFGSEVKSIKSGSVSLKESYIDIIDNELIWKQGYIKHYENKNTFNSFSETRERKLLAHKKQILKFKKSISLKGFSLIPISIYELNGRLKMEIALAKGRKLYDKRTYLKEKDQKRSIDREFKI